MEVYKATCMLPALQKFIIEIGKETFTLHLSQEEKKKNPHCAIWPLIAVTVQKWDKLRQEQRWRWDYLWPWSQVIKAGFEATLYSSSIRSVEM